MTQVAWDLKGQVAVVTGAARLIGHAVALGLARAGASVLVTDVLPHVEATAQEIVRHGGAAKALVADLRDIGAIGEVLSAVTTAFGALDILVNVAGLLVNVATIDCSEKNWDRHTDVNYKAVFFCSQAAARLMIPSRRGKIVNITSTSAFVSSQSPKVPYDSTKGAVRQLTVAMAHELAPFNIHVNAVAPRSIQTPMNFERLSDPAARAQSVSQYLSAGWAPLKMSWGPSYLCAQPLQTMSSGIPWWSMAAGSPNFLADAGQLAHTFWRFACGLVTRLRRSQSAPPRQPPVVNKLRQSSKTTLSERIDCRQTAVARTAVCRV